MNDVVTRLERALAFARMLPDHMRSNVEIGQDNDGSPTLEWYFRGGGTLVASVEADATVCWAINVGPSVRDHARMPIEQAASAITSNYNRAASPGSTAP